MKVTIGVDVGGTNTDAVALAGKVVLGAAKAITSSDVTHGIVDAIQALIKDVEERNLGPLDVKRVHIGTTHFMNALVQRRHLDPVSVIRLCRPATLSIPPFHDFPAELRKHVFGSSHMVSGGYEFDGQSLINEISEDEIKQCLLEIKAKCIKNIVVSGIFAPVNKEQEQQVGILIKDFYSEASYTLSNDVGHIGLLERENASIINESLKRLCVETVKSFKQALQELKLTCPLYLTQNDGTLLSAAQVLELPVRTFSSGPTNSMRGAAYLSGLSNAIVVDIGGTTSDIGVLMSGFPREAATQVKVGGVRTNFRMPDVLSLGLGGGSVVSKSPKLQVGPRSVGYRLTREGIVFGGSTITATDIAVAGKLVHIGKPENVGHLPNDLVKEAMDEMHRLIEDNIDKMKISEDDIDLVLVGGGTIVVDPSRKFMGVRHIHKPVFFEVANAVGAALSQVSGTVDVSVNLHTSSRDIAVERVKSQAIQAAIDVGAIPDSVEIVDFTDIPVAYQPNDATRMSAKAVGNLECDEHDDIELNEKPNLVYVQARVENDPALSPKEIKKDIVEREDDLLLSDPKVNPETGTWELSEFDLHCLAIGCGILGCGGGGNPTIGRMRAQQALRSGKKIEVITPEKLLSKMTRDQKVIALLFMGAPLVWIEKLPNGEELIRLAEVFVHADTKGNNIRERKDIIEKDGLRFISDYGATPAMDPTIVKKKLAAVVPAEIGGFNCMEPFTVGAALGLPVLDADGMGRAFPELQMIAPFMYGLPAGNAFISDEHGNVGVALEADTPKQLEDYFRAICLKMGCSAGVLLAPMQKDDMKGRLVPHTISQAWRLGQAVLVARRNKTDPIQAVLDNQQGRLLSTGKIVDVQRKTEGGFNRGQVKIDCFANGNVKENIIVLFQNENLVAKRVQMGKPEEVLVSTPDLICILVLETGEPVPTEELRYGLRVAVLAIPAPPILRTDTALAVVGPQAFGYPKDEVVYKSMGGYKPSNPIPQV